MTSIQQPLTMPKEELRRRYDDLAPDYSRMQWLEDYVFGVRRLRRKLMQRARGKVLDVACGTGESFPYFHSAVEITAVDLSTGMVEIARRCAEQTSVLIRWFLPSRPVRFRIRLLHCRRCAASAGQKAASCYTVEAGGAGWDIIRIATPTATFKPLAVAGTRSHLSLLGLQAYTSYPFGAHFFGDFLRNRGCASKGLIRTA